MCWAPAGGNKSARAEHFEGVPHGAATTADLARALAAIREGAEEEAAADEEGLYSV